MYFRHRFRYVCSFDALCDRYTCAYCARAGYIHLWLILLLCSYYVGQIHLCVALHMSDTIFHRSDTHNSGQIHQWWDSVKVPRKAFVSHIRSAIGTTRALLSVGMETILTDTLGTVSVDIPWSEYQREVIRMFIPFFSWILIFLDIPYS